VKIIDDIITNDISLSNEDLRTVIKSIDQGALRVSGNILVNS